MAEVKGELKVLRELLLKRNQAQPTENAAMAKPVAEPAAASPAVDQVSEQIAALQKAAEQIQQDIARLNSAEPAALQGGLASISLTQQPTPQQMVQTQAQMAPDMMEDPAVKTAKRLQYLMSEIGLDAKTAMMLLQMGQAPAMGHMQTPHMQGNQLQANPMQLQGQTYGAQPVRTTTQPLYQDDIVAQILAELEGTMPVQNQQRPIQNTAQPTQFHRTHRPCPRQSISFCPGTSVQLRYPATSRSHRSETRKGLMGRCLSALHF